MTTPTPIKVEFGLPANRVPSDLFRLKDAAKHYGSYELLAEWNSQGLKWYHMGRRAVFVSISETDAFIRNNARVKAGQEVAR